MFCTVILPHSPYLTALVKRFIKQCQNITKFLLCSLFGNFLINVLNIVNGQNIIKWKRWSTKKCLAPILQVVFFWLVLNRSNILFGNVFFSDPDAQFSCDFCPLYFGDRSDRNAHILDHFVKKTCTDCNKNIVQIGDDWYELHVDIKLSNVKCEPPLDIENETVPTEYGEIIADPDCDSLYLDGESLSDVPAGSSMHTEMNEHNLDDAADISSTDANFESIKYICAYCHVNFNMERTLRRHILREHNSETTQYCSTCSESFKNPYSLLNHMEANHKFLPPINLSVDQADVDEKFVIMNLNDIQSKSNRTCRFCKRTFQSIGHMKDHIRVISIFIYLLLMLSCCCCYCAKFY